MEDDVGPDANTRLLTIQATPSFGFQSELDVVKSPVLALDEVVGTLPVGRVLQVHPGVVAAVAHGITIVEAGAQGGNHRLLAQVVAGGGFQVQMRHGVQIEAQIGQEIELVLDVDVGEHAVDTPLHSGRDFLAVVKQNPSPRRMPRVSPLDRVIVPSRSRQREHGKEHDHDGSDFHQTSHGILSLTRVNHKVAKRYTPS